MNHGQRIIGGRVVERPATTTPNPLIQAVPWPVDWKRVVTPASWVGVVICLAAYLFGTGTQFDIANALLFPIVAAPALLARAYPSAFISCAFGVIGALHLCGVAV